MKPTRDLTRCPYDGTRVVKIRFGSPALYPYSRDYGPVYACPQCTAYVGTHKHDESPKGTVADYDDRELRKTAHAALDPYWRGGGQLSRGQAYAKLARELGISGADCHIGHMHGDQLHDVIRVCATWGLS